MSTSVSRGGGSNDGIQQRVFVEAARDGNTDMVERLLNRKIHPDVEVNESTALNQAVLNSHIEVIELLLRRKADVGKPDVGGQHPLMKCARSGQDEICIELLRSKAETNAVDSVFYVALCPFVNGILFEDVITYCIFVTVIIITLYITVWADCIT